MAEVSLFVIRPKYVYVRPRVKLSSLVVLDQDTKDWADDGGGGGQNSGRRYSCLGCDHRFSTFQVCLVTLTFCKLF